MLESNPFRSLFFKTLFVLDPKKQQWSLRSKNQSSTPVILVWTVFTSYNEDIADWSACIHPEGGRYFHNAAKVLVHSL